MRRKGGRGKRIEGGKSSEREGWEGVVSLEGDALHSLSMVTSIKLLRRQGEEGLR